MNNYIQQFNSFFKIPDNVEFRYAELEIALVRKFGSIKYRFQEKIGSFPEVINVYLIDSFERESLYAYGDDFTKDTRSALANIILKYTKYNINENTPIFIEVVKKVYKDLL